MPLTEQLQDCLCCQEAKVEEQWQVCDDCKEHCVRYDGTNQPYYCDAGLERMENDCD